MRARGFNKGKDHTRIAEVNIAGGRISSGAVSGVNSKIVWRERIHGIALATHKPVRRQDPVRNLEHIVHGPATDRKSHSDSARIRAECEPHNKEQQGGTNMQFVSIHSHCTIYALKAVSMRGDLAG